MPPPLRGSGQFPRQSVRRQQSEQRRPRPAAMSDRNPAPIARSASVAATVSISRSRSPPCLAASPTTRRPARACARRRRRHCSPTAIPVRTSIRRCRSAASPIRRLPNAFHYRQEFNPSCTCKAAGQSWADALKRHRRQGRRRTAGRHHRHRRARQEDVAARRGKPAPASKKGALRADATQRRHTVVRRAPPAASPGGALGEQADPVGRADLYPRAVGYQPSSFYSSNASAEPRLARDTSVWSGSGSGLPVSRKLLVMG